MTYKLGVNTSAVPAVPEIALLRATNSDTPLTTSSVITFEDNISDVTHNGISSGLSLTSTGLSLGVGHWQVQAFLGTDNDDDTDNNIRYRWHVDGTGLTLGAGADGVSEMAGYTNTNSADAVISVDTGTVTVELKFVTVNVVSSIVLVPSYSPVVIWKVS